MTERDESVGREIDVLAVSNVPGSPFPRMMVLIRVGSEPGAATDVVIFVYSMNPCSRLLKFVIGERSVDSMRRRRCYSG